MDVTKNTKNIAGAERVIGSYLKFEGIRDVITRAFTSNALLDQPTKEVSFDELNIQDVDPTEENLSLAKDLKRIIADTHEEYLEHAARRQGAAVPQDAGPESQMRTAGISIVNPGYSGSSTDSQAARELPMSNRGEPQESSTSEPLYVTKNTSQNALNGIETDHDDDSETEDTTSESDISDFDINAGYGKATIPAASDLPRTNNYSDSSNHQADRITGAANQANIPSARASRTDVASTKQKMVIKAVRTNEGDNIFMQTTPRDAIARPSTEGMAGLLAAENNPTIDTPTSTKSIGRQLTGTTERAEQHQYSHADELRAARTQNGRLTESTDSSNPAEGLVYSAEIVPPTTDKSRKRAHSTALETNSNHKRMRTVQKPPKKNPGLNNSASVISKAPSVASANFAHGVGLPATSAVTGKVITKSPNLEIIDLISDSEDDKERNSVRTLREKVHHGKPLKKAQGKIEQPTEIIDLCSESDGGSINESEEPPSRFGWHEPKNGREDGNALVQAAPGQKTEPGLSTPLSHIQPAWKPPTFLVPTVSTASQNTLQTTSSLNGRAETSMADQAGHLQHRAPSAPSSNRALARPLPEIKAIEQETHTYVAPQQTACSSTPTLAASNRSTETRSRPLSTPQLATPGLMQMHPPQHKQIADSSAKSVPISQEVAAMSRNGHLPAGSLTAQHRPNIPTAPGNILPVATPINPTQGNKTGVLQTQPENTAQLVSPLVREQKTKQANGATESHYRPTTSTATPRASAGQARTNAAKVPRTANPQASQRRHARQYESVPRNSYQGANYYHDNTRDRRLPDRGPTEDRSNAWGHDPKGMSCLLLNIPLWC